MIERLRDPAQRQRDGGGVARRVPFAVPSAFSSAQRQRDGGGVARSVAQTDTQPTGAGAKAKRWWWSRKWPTLRPTKRRAAWRKGREMVVETRDQRARGVASPPSAAQRQRDDGGGSRVQASLERSARRWGAKAKRWWRRKRSTTRARSLRPRGETAKRWVVESQAIRSSWTDSGSGDVP